MKEIKRDRRQQGIGKKFRLAILDNIEFQKKKYLFLSVVTKVKCVTRKRVNALIPSSQTQREALPHQWFQ